MDEMASDLAGRTGNQHKHGALPILVASTSIVMGGRSDAAFKIEPQARALRALPRRPRRCGMHRIPLLSQATQASPPNDPRQPVSRRS
jgi:hypothetical protein